MAFELPKMFEEMEMLSGNNVKYAVIAKKAGSVIGIRHFLKPINDPKAVWAGFKVRIEGDFPGFEAKESSLPNGGYSAYFGKPVLEMPAIPQWAVPIYEKECLGWVQSLYEMVQSLGYQMVLDANVVADYCIQGVLIEFPVFEPKPITDDRKCLMGYYPK